MRVECHRDDAGATIARDLLRLRKYRAVAQVHTVEIADGEDGRCVHVQ